MKKSISTKVLVVIGILVIVIAYFFLVQGPISEESNTLKTEQATLQSTLDEDQVKVTKLAKMQAELEVIKSSGDAKALASYNNYNGVLKDLNNILGDAKDYYIEFTNSDITDNIVCREIEITFITSSYDKATDLIKTIKASDMKYSIRDMSIAESSTHDGSEEWNSTVYLAEYEMKN